MNRLYYACYYMVSALTLRDGIAKMAGFTSRTRLFVSFMEETGLTPKEFIEQNR